MSIAFADANDQMAAPGMASLNAFVLCLLDRSGVHRTVFLGWPVGQRCPTSHPPLCEVRFGG